MWRTLFIALGVMAMIFGLEFMIIDSATIYAGRESTMLDFFDPTGSPAQVTRDWRPQEWLPWGILSFGAIVVVYSLVLPSRFRSAGIA